MRHVRVELVVEAATRLCEDFYLQDPLCKFRTLRIRSDQAVDVVHVNNWVEEKCLLRQMSKGLGGRTQSWEVFSTKPWQLRKLVDDT